MSDSTLARKLPSVSQARMAWLCITRYACSRNIPAAARSGDSFSVIGYALEADLILAAAASNGEISM